MLQDNLNYNQPIQDKDIDIPLILRKVEVV